MQSSIGGRRRDSGFSLIEVLVAIVVLSFGLLGMVGLQATALQNNREARMQSTAVNLARELAEMMRGNKDVAMLTAGNPYLGDFTHPLKPPAPSYCLSVGSSCSDASEVAAAELTEWLARVEASLPGARVTICRDTAPYSAAGLPQWDCTAGATADGVVVKVGWTRLSTNSAAQNPHIRTGSDSTDNRPSVILPVTAGSTAL